MFNRSYEFKWW